MSWSDRSRTDDVTSGGRRVGAPRHDQTLMPPFRPQVETFSGGLVLTLSGELDAYDAPFLRTSFTDAAAAAEGATVVLDLAAVTFLDSTALGTVVGLLRRVRESGGELRVVLPETEARRIFELTALDRSLDVRPSRERALAG